MIPHAPRGADHVADLLPAYLNHTLDREAMERVEVHLGACGACQAELEQWRVVARLAHATSSAIAPSSAVMDRAWSVIAPRGTADRPPVSPARGWAWTPRLPRRVLIGAGIAAALAGILACAADITAGGRLLSYILPMIAAVAIAGTIGPASGDAPHGSDRSAFAVRFGLGLGYMLVLALAASAMPALLRGGDMGVLALRWLGPTLLLSAASLLGTRLIRPAAGASGACGLCFLHALAALAGLESGPSVFGMVMRGLWTTNPATLAVSALLVLGAMAVPPATAAS